MNDSRHPCLCAPAHSCAGEPGRHPRARNACAVPALLGFVLLAIASATFPLDAGADTLEDRVRTAALDTYIHGMTDEIAVQTVGEEGVPVLLGLLADPDFPRRDNVVAFLTYLGGDEATEGLLGLLRRPPAPVDIPEEDRSLLLAPQALGHIAARGHARALEALLAITATPR